MTRAMSRGRSVSNSMYSPLDGWMKPRVLACNACRPNSLIKARSSWSRPSKARAPRSSNRYSSSGRVISASIGIRNLTSWCLAARLVSAIPGPSSRNPAGPTAERFSIRAFLRLLLFLRPVEVFENAAEIGLEALDFLVPETAIVQIGHFPGDGLVCALKSAVFFRALD